MTGSVVGIARDLMGRANRRSVTVGLETRTEIDMQPVGAVQHVKRGGALASAPNPSFIAGGDRHVQRETVKALRQSLGWFLAPGGHVRYVALPGPRKPSTERTTMNTIPAIDADSVSDYPLDVMGNAVADALVILRTVFAAADDGSGLYFTTDMHGCLGVAIDRLEHAQKVEALLHKHFKITGADDVEGKS